MSGRPVGDAAGSGDVGSETRAGFGVVWQLSAQSPTAISAGAEDGAFVTLVTVGGRRCGDVSTPWQSRAQDAAPSVSLLDPGRSAVKVLDIAVRDWDDCQLATLARLAEVAAEFCGQDRWESAFEEGRGVV